MKKMYTRTILREIRHSIGRFAAIIAIVALGVGFLMGLLSSTPDMKATADSYYRNHAMSDFDIKSTMGLTSDDADALASLPQVDQVMPGRVTDALMTSQAGERLTGRIYGLDLSSLNINKLTLKEGRMPQDASECVIESPNSYMSPLSVGDILTLSPDNKNRNNTYTQESFTIVGIVDSPFYFCNSKEPASTGNGRAGAVLYTDSSAYRLDTYTDIFMTIHYDGSSFSDEYQQQIDTVYEAIENCSVSRIKIRYDEILQEAREKLSDAREKLKKEKETARKELAEAEKDLSQGEKELADGRAELEKAKKQVSQGEKELKKGQKQLKSGQKQLQEGRAQLDASKEQLDASKDSVEEAKSAQAAGITLAPEVLAQIQAYDQGLATWEKGSAHLDKQEKKLAASQKQLQSSKKQLQSAHRQISQNEKKLADAAQQLKQGRIQYENAKKEAETQFAKAEKKIKKNEDKLKDIKKPEWYILDRNSNVSYARYKVDAEKVAAVATVFPVFFFLVAALVCLTTMTRMVEEERIQIGTLKALGYRRSTIMSKYLIYCGSATVIGCILGLLLGFYFLPSAIYHAYASMYQLPELIVQFNWPYAVLSCGLEILCTLGATWFSCTRTLQEKPAALMVPRAPKAGKRILLEHMGIIWKKLSFSYKATARNIFRYKKHLIMTVVSIAGCTALMVAGFGMQDSMSKIVDSQYTDILKFDMRIELSEDKTDSVLETFLDGKKYVKVQTMNGEVRGTKNKEVINATITVPENSKSFKDFVDLHTRKNRETLSLERESVIMTEKMADFLELSTGDTFTVTDSNDISCHLTLAGITENYAGCMVYMDKELYEDSFDHVEYNGYLLKSHISGLKAQDHTAAKLQDSDYVSSVEFTSQSQESYETMLSSINMIVYILILCAGILAVVVLYNLTNININERSRELATLRVLGYHHSEVARYILREIGILSVLGTLAGLIAGRALHYYVVVIAETADMMMGRDIQLSSYILAAVLTLVFSAFVDFLMTFKLRRIPMVESMKAVD